jgi:ABC-type transport system involved in multi-copper enzyme maturation permease subunit
VPFSRLVRLEFRKSYDTRAGMWLLISIGIIVSLVEAVVLVIALVNQPTMYFTDFAFIASTPISLLLPVLAIMLVTSEWSQRGAMVTFAIEPRRIRVVLAKWLVAVVYALLTVVVMLLVALVMTAIYSAAYPESAHWTGSASGTPHVLPYAVVQVLTMSIGFAFGALLLNTPAAIVLFFLYWYLLPGVLAAIGSIRDWIGNLLDWINFQSAVQPLVDGSISTGEEWGKILVSGLIFIVVPLVAGIARILRAEVK